MLTRDDPRHIFNVGAGGDRSSSPPRIKIVNAIDSGDVVSEGLSTSPGEEAVLNVIRANAPAVRAAIE